MTEPVIPVYVRKCGGSVVLALPRRLREALGVTPGDLMGVRKVGRIVIIKKLVAGEIMPVSVEEARDAAEKVKE